MNFHSSQLDILHVGGNQHIWWELRNTARTKKAFLWSLLTLLLLVDSENIQHYVNESRIISQREWWMVFYLNAVKTTNRQKPTSFIIKSSFCCHFTAKFNQFFSISILFLSRRTKVRWARGEENTIENILKIDEVTLHSEWLISWMQKVLFCLIKTDPYLFTQSN